MPVAARALAAWRWLVDPATIGLPLLLTIALRLIHSAIAAGCGLLGDPDPALVHSNALTGQLMSRADGVGYLVLGVWERFDTLWYLQIAEAGYARPASVVFFPLYPLLIRALSALGLPPLAAALAISTLATFAMLWGLQRLLLLDRSPQQVRRALLVCALWPASFVFFAGYAESLVLALVIWAIYCARQDRWWPAALVAAVAGLAKAVGGLAVVPLALLAWRQRRWRAIPVLFGPVGLVGYLSYLAATGRPSPSEAYAQYWTTTVAWPWDTFLATIDHLLSGQNLALWINALLLAVACSAALVRRVRPEYTLYALATLGLLLTKKSDPSQQQWGRYALLLFPAYAGVAAVPLERALFALLLVAMFALDGFLTYLFVGWSLAV